MKYLYIILLFSFISCHNEASEIKDHVEGCLKEAVIKDLTGLDGCDFVFELTDETRLIPERRVYIQAPDPQDDPIYHFKMKDGEKVKISYRDSQLLGACMAGKIVFITCITSKETDGK